MTIALVLISLAVALIVLALLSRQPRGKSTEHHAPPVAPVRPTSRPATERPRPATPSSITNSHTTTPSRPMPTPSRQSGQSRATNSSRTGPATTRAGSSSSSVRRKPQATTTQKRKATVQTPTCRHEVCAVLDAHSQNEPQILFERTHGFLKAVAAIQKPMVRGTLWSIGGASTRLLAFPYLIYVIGFWQGELAKIYIYYSNSPITKLQDTLYRSNLPNVYADDSCCLGSSTQLNNFRKRISRFSQSQRVEKVIDGFWAFRFNSDMTSNCFNPIAINEPRLSSLESWERHSRIDKSFVLTVSWRRACTVSEAMSRYLSS